MSCRIWVDNTVSNSMRVKITDIQRDIKIFSVPAHGNKSYVGNGVLSGTVLVRVSDVALS